MLDHMNACRRASLVMCGYCLVTLSRPRRVMSSPCFMRMRLRFAQRTWDDKLASLSPILMEAFSRSGATTSQSLEAGCTGAEKGRIIETLRKVLTVPADTNAYYSRRRLHGFATPGGRHQRTPWG